LDGQSGEPEEQRFIRYFTLGEANALLPTLLPTLLQLKEEKEQFDQLRRSLEVITPTMRGNGHGAIAVDYERRINELVTRMSDGIRQLAEMGIEVKDLNQGLIDFPHWREDRVVFLCWRLGEPAINFWHEIDAGFAGRQELHDSDDPFDPPLPSNL
jgi:hypothetical protein